MQHSEGSDAELVDQARAGSAPAFAVLLYRHGPAVRAVVADDRDPTGAVIGTFVRAMRRLPDHAEDSVRDRLVELAGVEVKRPRPPEPPVTLDDDELDEIWAELDLRWPDGKVPRSLPPWVLWSTSIVTLAALAVLVPYAVLTLGGAGEEGPEELDSIVARPFDEQIEPPPVDELEENLEPPPFEFPSEQPDPSTGGGEPADGDEVNPDG